MSSVENPSSLSVSDKRLVIILLAALALVGFLGVLVATRWGAGTSPDSIVYIAGARNLAAGLGFTTISGDGQLQAITHHAPFYSAALALLDLVGLDPLQGARWLNALVFAGNIFLVGILLLELLPGTSSEALWAPVIGAGLIVVPGFLIEIHSMVWSESLFIFLTLAGLLSLSRCLERKSTGYLIAAAILVALAFLTRYIGIVLVAVGEISILLFSLKSLRQKIIDSVVFGFFSAGPMGLWLLRNSLLGGTATSRELLFHPIHRQQIGLTLTTLGSWFMIPDNSPGIIKVLPYLAILLLVAGVWMGRANQSERKASWVGWVTLVEFPYLIRIILVFIPLYFAFVAASLTFLDANIPLDSRILLPIYVTGVILVVFLLLEASSLVSMPAVLRFVLIGAGSIFILFLLGKSVAYVRSGYSDGIGFTSLRWRESPTMAALMNYPSEKVIYSNAPEALYLYTKFAARAMPRKFESANQRPNLDYDVELKEMKQQILDQGAIIVYFYSINRPSLPAKQEILDVLGFQVLQQTADGVIYGIKDQD